MIVDLEHLDYETIRLIANEFSKIYGDYEIIGTRVSWEKGSPTLEEIDAIALDLYKKKAIAVVNARAEEKRNEYLTPGSGQTLRYIKIEQEAIKAIDDENPTMEKYPLLASDIGSPDDGGFGATILDVAKVVLFTSKMWTAKEVALNMLRRTFLGQVKQAQSVDAIVKILGNIKYDI